MSELNYNYKLKLKVLTPLHIGAGKEKDWIKGIDYIIHNGYLYILNQKKLFEYLNNKQLLEKYINLISKNHYSEIEKFFRENLKEDIKSISQSTYENINNINTEIKYFIRDGMGKAYIPGSSIKGAIRSVLFSYILKNHNKEITSITKYDRRTNSEVPIEKREYIEYALGNYDKSIMRFIKPNDIYGLDDYLSIYNVNLYNVKHPQNNSKSETKNIVTIECLYPFENIPSFDFQLNIAEPFINVINNKYNRQYNLPKYKNDVFKNREKETIHHLFKIINEYTYQHIEKEIKFFEKYTHTSNIEENIIKKLKEIQDKTKDHKKSCVLRMSYGSGFHGITGDWLFDDHSIDTIKLEKNKTDEDYKSVAYLNKRKTAKSRRIIDDTYPLGFIELILLDDRPDNLSPFSAEKVSDSKVKSNIPKVEISKTNEINKTNQNIIEHTQPRQSFKTITRLNEIAKGKYVVAEISQLGKPSHKVKIVLENKIFETIISNVKNANLKIGDKVIAEIKDNKGSEKINMVAFVSHFK
ncbi:MAG: type III-A CRISPR-associated RAMP protein Csm5 [Bacteroidales bacterium]|nr:type III-A CRISPR-associated RAMP protein Csm5 [Bacteroidales bacterium]